MKVWRAIEKAIIIVSYGKNGFKDMAVGVEASAKGENFPHSKRLSALGACSFSSPFPAPPSVLIGFCLRR